MLQSLHISNLAVIAAADVELSDGLNVFTGATGAGKSLLLGALEVLLGLRSAGDLVRGGADEARVSGLFVIRNERLARQAAAIIDAAEGALDGGELLLTRRIFANGRTAATVNGRPVTVAMLRTLAETLIDIHGQHDHQYLLKPANQLELLDSWAGLTQRRDRLAELYARFRAAQVRRSELQASAQLRDQQLELYRFQADEIDAAQLADGELEALQAEHRKLANLAKLKSQAGAIYHALYEGDDSLLDRLAGVVGLLRELAILDDSLRPSGELANAAAAELQEASYNLRRYTDRLEMDPARAAEVEERLNLIHRLTGKYGQTIAEVLTYRDRIGGQIGQLESAAADFSQLDGELAPMRDALLADAEAIHAARVKSAAQLARQVEVQLKELGMAGARLDFWFAEPPTDPEERAARLGPAGLDEIEMLVTTNPGQPARPLRKIASGGEISRIMLAIKSVFARADSVSVLVFDEIDANVGGRLGSVIGNKLAALARSHQVVCITHLPQIAAFADRHLTVRKSVAGRDTETTVRAMAGDERVGELAEMIGGAHATATTRRQAEELLALAEKTRNAKSPAVKSRSQKAK